MIIWDGARKLLKGNTHMHTTLSDGRRTPQEAMDIYRQNGYDFIVISDHRKVTVPTTMDQGMLTIQGIEFDFNLTGQVIHIVGVGVPEAITDKVERHMGPQRAIDEINAAGGCAILAHPAWSLNTTDVIHALHGLCAAEIYNTVSAAPWNVDRADSSNILDACAAGGTLLPLVAADDTHYYEGETCKSYIWLAAEANTEAAVKDALRRGDFYATRGPRFERVTLEGNTLRVQCSPVRTIMFPSDLPWGTKRVITGDGITEASFMIARERFQRFVRVMIEDENGNRAWLSPIDLTKV